MDSKPFSTVHEGSTPPSANVAPPVPASSCHEYQGGNTVAGALETSNISPSTAITLDGPQGMLVDPGAIRYLEDQLKSKTSETEIIQQEFRREKDKYDYIIESKTYEIEKLNQKVEGFRKQLSSLESFKHDEQVKYKAQIECLSEEVKCREEDISCIGEAFKKEEKKYETKKAALEEEIRCINLKYQAKEQEVSRIKDESKTKDLEHEKKAGSKDLAHEKEVSRIKDNKNAMELVHVQQVSCKELEYEKDIGKIKERCREMELEYEREISSLKEKSKNKELEYEKEEDESYEGRV